MTRKRGRARQLFDAHADTYESLFVSDVVLAEFAWVLRSRYELHSAAIATALAAMLDNATLAWQSRATIVEALRLFEHAKVDFPDCLIVAVAQAHRCDVTATFDQGMRTLPGVRIL